MKTPGSIASSSAASVIPSVSRRALLSAALSAPFIASASTSQAAAKPWALKFGLASYSMRKQTLDQVIEFCKAQRITQITLKEMHLPLASTPAQLAEARAKLEAAGITLAGVGVIYMKTEEEVARAFAYAKAAGAPLIVAAPNPELIDVVEKAVKEHDLPLAIHNHGPEDKHYQAPKDILPIIKKRDRRLGICMDVGHTVRAGSDPVRAIAECGARLFDLHLKDLKDKADRDSRTEIGAGIIDQVAILKALAKRRFSGHCAVEYEVNPTDPTGGIRESLAYLRGIAAAIGA